MTRKNISWLSGLALFLLGCGGLSLIAPPSPTSTIEPTWTESLPPDKTAVELPSQQPATSTLTPSPTHTFTSLPSETPPPTSSFTPTLTLEPQWVMQGPGEVIVPILLYHHIGYSLQGEPIYYVSPDAFDQQMSLLYQWGYRTISVELLIRAIKEGAELPPKPILLTFDDGSETIYTTALPIMQRYHFTGTSYIIYNFVGIPNYMDTDQIRALYAAGWEIGSHSISHIDLTTRPDRQRDEIVESRRKLQSLLDVPILSFAHPFGAHNGDSLHYVHYAGYIAAMGLGNETLQGNENRYYLYRQSVRGTDDLKTFASRLPWQQDQIDLPALTIVP